MRLPSASGHMKHISDTQGFSAALLGLTCSRKPFIQLSINLKMYLSCCCSELIHIYTVNFLRLLISLMSPMMVLCKKKTSKGHTVAWWLGKMGWFPQFNWPVTFVACHAPLAPHFLSVFLLSTKSKQCQRQIFENNNVFFFVFLLGARQISAQILLVPTSLR